ncbi:MAG TPA: LLM class F420-dependent oxidoreductase, partial [Dactylosporangium sp.]|nr:LLM class F420-dependent oxidoreductase [Dactylosporangium sp.]
TAEAGRDPGEVGCTFQVGLSTVGDATTKERRPYTGSIEQIAGDIAQLAEAGVDHVFVTVPTVAEDMDEYEDIAGRFYTAIQGI